MGPRDIFPALKYLLNFRFRHTYIFGETLLAYAEIQASVLHADLCRGLAFCTKLFFHSESD